MQGLGPMHPLLHRDEAGWSSSHQSHTGDCPSLEDCTEKQGSLLGLEFVGIHAWESDLPFSPKSGDTPCGGKVFAFRVCQRQPRLRTRVPRIPLYRGGRGPAGPVRI